MTVVGPSSSVRGSRPDNGPPDRPGAMARGSAAQKKDPIERSADHSTGPSRPNLARPSRANNDLSYWAESAGCKMVPENWISILGSCGWIAPSALCLGSMGRARRESARPRNFPVHRLRGWQERPSRHFDGLPCRLCSVS